MTDANPQSPDNPIPGKPSVNHPIISTTDVGNSDSNDLSRTSFRPPHLSVIHILAFIILAAGLILLDYLGKQIPRPGNSWSKLVYAGLLDQ